MTEPQPPRGPVDATQVPRFAGPESASTVDADQILDTHHLFEVRRPPQQHLQLP